MLISKVYVVSRKSWLDEKFSFMCTIRLPFLMPWTLIANVVPYHYVPFDAEPNKSIQDIAEALRGSIISVKVFSWFTSSVLFLLSIMMSHIVHLAYFLKTFLSEHSRSL